VIGSFADEATEDLYHGIRSKKAAKIPPDITTVALRKLDMINSAAKLDDLKIPPNNQLEKLTGNLKGFHSIRINDQFRVVFRWSDGIATAVAIKDYH
jgi:toxin HigB-1